MVHSKKPSSIQPIRSTDIHGLSVFRSIVECNGVSAAAAKLNVDVSTISRQLKDLEVRVGMRLCDRGRGGFSLTVEGIAIHKLSCDLLRSIENYEDQIDEIRNRVVGQLRIGAGNHVLSNVEISLQKVIRRFHQGAPEMDVAYNVLPSMEIGSAVRDGRIHIGLTTYAVEHPELVRSEICKEKQRLYCGRGHRLFDQAETNIDTAGLENYKYVARDHKTATDDIAKSLGLIQGTVANNIEAVTVLIQSGLYLGYLPTHHVDALLNSKNLRPVGIPSTDCNLPLYVYTRKEVRRLKPVQLFLDELMRFR